MSQQDTRSNFHSSLCSLKDLPETNFPNEFERIYSLNPQHFVFSIDDFNNILREIQEQANAFLEKFEEFDISASGPIVIRAILNCNSNVSDLINLVDRKVNFDLQNVFRYLDYINMKLSAIFINFIPFFRKFYFIRLFFLFF